jgi:hypothetical protein
VQAPDYHATRFSYDARRSVLWQTLCDSYFRGLVAPDDCVLELGAGYGDFINNIQCRQRIAVDVWDGFLKYIDKDVRARVSSVTSLDFLEEDTIDFVFASNLFEHLTQEELVRVIAALKKKVKHGGTLNILQPNFRYAYRDYFDDYTHKTIYTDVGLSDLLSAQGLTVFERHARFLPLTIRSRLPVVPLLIRLYLSSPIKPFAKQMFVRARFET